MATFIKVGGSLIKYPAKLRKLCNTLSEVAKNHQIVVVPGGGVFVNTVRKAHALFNLTEYDSHFMAILGMEQYGYLLHDLSRETSVVEQDLTEAVNLARNHVLPIFLPYKYLLNDKTLDHSWRVTSDTIAAHLAIRARSKRLILAKNVDGIFYSDLRGKKTELIKKITAEQLTSLGTDVVDEAFPHYLVGRNLDTYIVNGHKPERIFNIFQHKKNVCTHLV